MIRITEPTMSQQFTCLFKKEGTSDKQYNVHLEPQGDGFIVYGMNGRRGGTLKQQLKTQQPVALDAAQPIYDQLVAKKKKDGYTEDASGQAYVGTELSGRVSGVLPMLLNPVGEQAALALQGDAQWAMELKFDGERRLVKIDTDGSVVGINRKGLTVPLPASVVASLSAASLKGETVLDGELVGEELVVFDVLRLGGGDLCSDSFGTRLLVRSALEAKLPGIQFATTATSAAEKREMLERARATNQEGVVFKRLDAPYVAGRPASGGAALKLKFVETASVRICVHNAGKRSVGMEVLDVDTGRWMFVGNVTVPADQPVPEVGAVCEVRYLYAHEAGALFQPVLLGVRGDLDASDCVRSQLKFKAPAALAA
jgi:bifunctional non-homologous end joining protein LigD